MELQTITEDVEVAKRLHQEYRAEVRKPLREKTTEAQRELRRLDTEMARAYKQLADGVTLLRLTETIKAGGLMDRDTSRVATPRVGTNDCKRSMKVRGRRGRRVPAPSGVR